MISLKSQKIPGSNNGYGNVTIDGLIFDYTMNIVDITIITNGDYFIEAVGVAGGSGSGSVGGPGGLGVAVEGSIFFSAGTTLDIVVGASASTSGTTPPQPLLVAPAPRKGLGTPKTLRFEKFIVLGVDNACFWLLDRGRYDLLRYSLGDGSSEDR